MLLYHLLGKVPFPTVWELCLIINTCVLIRSSKKEETSKVSAGNETLFLLSWTRLSSCDLAILEVPSKPNSFHFALSRLGSFAFHVLGLKEMPLSFKLFNRFLLGQKTPECPLESCRTQDVLSVCEGSTDGQPIKDPGHSGLETSQQIIGNNWSQIKNL